MVRVDLSIIIVNYNGKHYLKECLQSIKTHCSSLAYEVVIVDNLSTDGSQEFIKSKFSWVRLIENNSNDGFAKANNLGVEIAKGEVILLLNNDTVLVQDFSNLVSEVKKESIGAITIQMLNGNEEYTPSFGKFPSPFSLLKIANMNDNRSDLVSGNFNKTVYSMDWISGSFVLTKKSDWDLVGGLDEDYFMYVEDVDFCRKLKNHHKQILFYPDYRYIHFVGFNSSRELKLIKGYHIYCEKHFKGLNAVIGKMMLRINYVYKRVFKNIR